MYGPSAAEAILPLAIAFFGAVVLTPLVRALARRRGLVAAPKPDRWHSKPTAMFGGAAIFVAVVPPAWLVAGGDPRIVVILVSSGLLFLVGLVDDIRRIKPYQKLIGQVVGAAIPVYFGLALHWTPFAVANDALTIFWIIGITNAVNLLDNMDGLAAGIAGISALFLAAYFLLNGQTREALLLATFAAGLFGFLIYNSNPASIFMGDCGSMFVGFFLSSTSLLTADGAAGRSRTLLAPLVVPVLIFLVPIFDTTLVTLLRRISGRAISQGGRDHASHRLVGIGMSERRAVRMLYVFAIVSGFLGIAVRDQPIDISIALITPFAICLTLIGVYLAGVKVYDSPARAEERPVVSFLVDLSYKRRVFEVLLDVVAILFAYYVAYAFVFGPMRDTPDWRLFTKTAPLVVIVKLAAFLALGVYRGLWRYTSLRDVVVYAKGVIVGSGATILLMLVLYRFIGFSRLVFAIDGAVLFVFLCVSRAAFRLLRAALPKRSEEGRRRALIFGAGDAGELLIRELMNNDALGRNAVGFLDDDARKAGKMLHGRRIFDSNVVDVGELCRSLRVDEVLVSSQKIPDARLRQLLHQTGIAIRRMRIDLVEFEPSATGDEPEAGAIDLTLRRLRRPEASPR